MALIQYSIVELKRIFTVRGLFTAIILVPLILGLSSSIFPTHIKKSFMFQINLILSLSLIILLQVNRYISDKSSGLWDGLLSCPITPATIFAGRIFASLFVLMSQIIIFFLIISIG
ncbi:MAG: hypothetical protein SNJ70_09650 [Armatimonadota bacterium]